MTAYDLASVIHEAMALAEVEATKVFIDGQEKCPTFFTVHVYMWGERSVEGDLFRMRVAAEWKANDELEYLMVRHDLGEMAPWLDADPAWTLYTMPASRGAAGGDAHAGVS